MLLPSMFSKKNILKFIRLGSSSLIDQNENALCYTLIFGKENMNDSKNTNILKETIEYTLLTERFNVL